MISKIISILIAIIIAKLIYKYLNNGSFVIIKQ
jgi:hypothetical protein